MKVTRDEIFKAVEDTINAGDRVPQIKISGHNSPEHFVARLTDVDLAKLDPLNMFKGVSANDYAVRMSMLWSTIFWKIGEQILKVGNYRTPFRSFFEPMNLGTDIEELAPRIKDPIDRNSLSNSALFTNYVTNYDSFYHRINHFDVFATTYSNAEIARIATSWDYLTHFVNAELENIEKSVNTYLHRIAKAAISSQYLAGGMASIQIAPITDTDSAQNAAIAINTVINNFGVEPSSDYIGYNLNANNPAPIVDVAISDPVMVIRSDIASSIQFRTAMNTYFGAESKFLKDWIVVRDFETTVSSDIDITPGYTPVTSNTDIMAVVLERDAFIYRIKEYGAYNFDNVATLKTSVFHHLDVMANISDRRKAVAIVAN